jgi:hypothetical protein
MDEGARMPARLWIISSETEEQSTMNNLVAQYRDDPGVLVLQESIWTVKAHQYSDFPDNSFWVFRGSSTREPAIVEEWDRAFLENPENCIRVPERHRSAFQADIHKALRDLAGYSTGSSYRLFKSIEKLTPAVSITELFPSSFPLPFYGSDTQIQNECLIPQYFTSKMVNKSSPRYIHVDIGITGDRLGIACSYVKEMVKQRFYDDVNLREVEEEVPLVQTEWAFGIEADKGQEVPLYKIEAFIRWIGQQGFYIKKVSADGYQSKHLLQNLRLHGFDTEELSLDKTSEPYLELRNSTYRGLAIFPNNPILFKEFENLIVTRRGAHLKWVVDHPKKNPDQSPGSKDIADAVCGSQHQARVNAYHDRGFFGMNEKEDSEEKSLARQFWPDS